MTRMAMIALALVLAIGAGLMTHRILSRGNGNNDQVSVLVVNQDLEIGQTVTERQLSWQSWPRNNLNSHYITREGRPDGLKLMAGATVRQSVFAGEPVTNAKLVKREGTSVLAVVLEDGLRAVTLKVDEAQGVAGLVRPGDHVDVILTHKVNTTHDGNRAGERSISEAVARNVRVLAVGQDVKTEENAKQTKVPKSVTIEVNEKQAEAVTLGRNLGALSLSLRSVTGDDESDGAGNRRQGWTSDRDVSAALRDQAAPMVRVLVFTQEMTAGTFITDQDLRWQEVADNGDFNNRFVDDHNGEHKLSGALMLVDVAAGEQVRREMVVRPGENRFVPRALRPGHRAISVSIAKNSAVGSFVSPGDLVDVIFTDKITDSSPSATIKERSWSETVVRKVRVLSIEAPMDTATSLPQPGGTATLEALPRQVEAIALAANMGNLTLVLRSSIEPIGDAILADAGQLPVISATYSQGGGGAVDEREIAAPSAGPVGSPASGPVSGPDAGYTIDTAMSRGLRTLAGGATAANRPQNPQLLLIRGRERSVLTLDGR